MKKHRIALIGLGMAIKPHAASFLELHERLEVAAAYAPSAQRREQFAARYPFPVVDSPEAIFDDPSIDSVIILTPPWTHDQLVRRAAAAGKHVLVEKPIDVDAERAAGLVECCERAGVAFAVVFQHRFRPASLRLAALLRQGALGQVLSASASIRWWRSPEYYGGREGDPRSSGTHTSGTQPGRGTIARDGGGVLLTQAIHTLDLLLHLVGPVQEVMAYVDTSPLRAIDTEDIVAGSVRYANGATGVIDATTVTYPGYPERVEIAGTAGSAVLEVETLTVHYMNGERFQLAGASAGGGGADPMAFSHDHHRRVLMEFLDAIDGRREPMNSGRSALHVQRLIDALLASGRERRPVAVEGR